MISPFNYILGYRAYKRLCFIKDSIYTWWLKGEFKVCQGLIRRGLSLVGGDCISIGIGSSIGYNCVLSVWKQYSNYDNCEILIGDNVTIGDYNHITAIKRVVVGDGVLTGRFVTISDNNHGECTIENLSLKPLDRKVSCKGEVVIERNVWIGDKVTILSGVRIGEGSIIAANAVVTKDVPPFTIVGGVPAQVIKNFKKLI